MAPPLDSDILAGNVKDRDYQSIHETLGPQQAFSAPLPHRLQVHQPMHRHLSFSLVPPPSPLPLELTDSVRPSLKGLVGVQRLMVEFKSGSALQGQGNHILDRSPIRYSDNASDYMTQRTTADNVVRHVFAEPQVVGPEPNDSATTPAAMRHLRMLLVSHSRRKCASRAKITQQYTVN
ncbi:hypothetical protein BJX68DRAFT_268891 [Aspergillus pseudodeflectus]|uniref:Uncharacterized protein n=1 Tax=Aspergillus pseudodeflectus TaxID=176178 RepID=A0ABR4K1G3_9EURO